jgi:uncharacterized protein YyaL (SSP411 family)
MGNRLINEKSPYLLQHAHNPVDWHPWGEEAFEKALREDKPLFLSIGYSTCHWCHVMAHESFEDESAASLINSAFVSVKVDREERPDLDNIYMTVCQMLTGSGGWPLTIIMTPDKRPFFAGTYIPKNTRFGRTGLIELIPRIQEVWANRRKHVLDTADNIIAALKNMEEPVPGSDIDISVLDKAYNELAQRFDKLHGGFGSAPKFPSPHNLLFLLRYWSRKGCKEALEMVEQTLHSMRQGGIYDQVGFGLHRYSTDREWLVPHFEKMLYDQALLALACLETCQAAGTDYYAQISREIFTYVLRGMTSEQGGFFSAEDADSEGQEGRFYLWDEKEMYDILGKDNAELFIRIFGVEKAGNFKDEVSGPSPGLNILHLKKPISKIAEDLKLPSTELEGKIASLRVQLFSAREKRLHPSKDDKILTDWNGLMIAAFARGAQVLEDQACLDAAIKAADFLLGHLRQTNGRLLHRYRDGEAAIPAHLDDYVFLIWGLIELYEACFDTAYLKAALDLNKDMITFFWDQDKGGLFFTAADSETLLIRKKEVYDTAVPSGNSVAMLNLLRLARLTGRTDLEEKAADIGRAFSEQIRQMPSAHTFFLTAVDFYLGPSHEVVISGNSEGPDTIEMISTLRKRFIPNKAIILHPTEDMTPSIESLAEFVKGYPVVNDKATAYVCLNKSCKAPTTDPSEMLKLLGV